MSKKSRKGSPYARRSAFRPLRKSFLILCEGNNTEPAYFNAFRLATASVRALGVTSGDAMAVVRTAIKRRNAETNKGNIFDHSWVVFDKDDTPDDKFNAAIALAETEGFRVAYSNQAFELWFLLHFGFLSRSMHRSQYVNQLSGFLPFSYDNRAETAKLMFKVLFDLQPQAIENAKRLDKKYADEAGGNLRNPAVEEPSTTVHELVEALRAFL